MEKCKSCFLFSLLQRKCKHYQKQMHVFHGTSPFLFSVLAFDLTTTLDEIAEKCNLKKKNHKCYN